jgi:hypothetical protein
VHAHLPIQQTQDGMPKMAHQQGIAQPSCEKHAVLLQHLIHCWVRNVIHCSEMRTGCMARALGRQKDLSRSANQPGTRRLHCCCIGGGLKAAAAAAGCSVPLSEQSRRLIEFTCDSKSANTAMAPLGSIASPQRSPLSPTRKHTIGFGLRLSTFPVACGDS